MYTVYVNKGQGWFFYRDCATELQAICECALWDCAGFEADYSKPGQVEREQYD